MAVFRFMVCMVIAFGVLAAIVTGEKIESSGWKTWFALVCGMAGGAMSSTWERARREAEADEDPPIGPPAGQE